MAYVSQELKAKIAPKVKAICKKYGVKGSLSVSHHSGLVLTIKSGKLDFFKDAVKFPLQRDMTHCDVNVYHYRDHFTGKSLKFLSEVIPAMNEGNWDKSDIQSDYFNVGWYVYVNVGKWNKPYEVTV